MNFKVNYLFVGMILFLVCSCASGPVPIDYGNDECGECRMKISDHRFGAELITKKGKVKKYDSVECLVDFVLKNEKIEIGQIYVTDYLKPKVLTSGESAVYLISKKIPSPMGGFISSYPTMDDARAQKSSVGGQIYSWANLKSYLNK